MGRKGFFNKNEIIEDDIMNLRALFGFEKLENHFKALIEELMIYRY